MDVFREWRLGSSCECPKGFSMVHMLLLKPGAGKVHLREGFPLRLGAIIEDASMHSSPSAPLYDRRSLER